MHHNVLLLAAGLICTPIFAAPNANNRLNARKGHRHRQAPKPLVSVGTPYKPPSYGPPPDVVTVAQVSTVSPDSSSALVDPIGASTTSACSVVRITEYVTVYGTSPPTSSSTLGNFTSPPYGWNSSVGTSSFLGTGTGVVLPTSASANITTSVIANITTSVIANITTLVSANVTTSQPYFPISNSTTSDLPYATTGGQHQHNETSAVLPTFVNVTTTVNVTVLPTSTFLVPSNFTSFPNITTPDVTPTPIPTSSVAVSANFTSFANITSTPEISILPIPVPTSFANITSTPVISILPIPVPTSLSNFTSFANVSSSTAFFTNSSVPATTTTEEPMSSSGLTVTSFIIPTLTTDIIPGEPASSTAITSLVIATTMTPIDVATSSSTSTVTTLVIATTLSPIDTASVSLPELPTTIVTPTATVSSADAPTGTPNPEDIHCGIKGEAIGTFYLATYAYNKASVPVTLQGCFQFCSFAVEQCFSYEFYLEPGLGSPRCKLYGGPVAFEVDSIDPFQPYTWFDLACGDPTK